jgi:hypothetical protein
MKTNGVCGVKDPYIANLSVIWRCSQFHAPDEARQALHRSQDGGVLEKITAGQFLSLSGTKPGNQICSRSRITPYGEKAWE